jgi:S1-C subfamily serine protease
VLASEVIAGSPAARAGMAAGDLILKLGETEIATVDDLHRLLTAEAAGREVEVSLIRGAKIERLALTPEADAP